MARLDLNEAGGIPLIDDVPVTIDGVRVQIRDALVWAKGRLLLATSHGLCLYDLRWGNCQALHHRAMAALFLSLLGTLRSAFRTCAITP